MSTTTFYRRVVLSFITLAFLLILLILYFSLISVKIHITPEVTRERLDAIISITEGDVLSKPVSETLSGLIFEKEVEGAASFFTQGKKLIPSKILGSVIVQNDSPIDQTLVKTTRLLSSEGVLLRTSTAIIVPHNKKVEVQVYADKEAYFQEGGVVAPGTRFRIPGLSESRQEVVFAVNQEQLPRGGKEVPALSQEDEEIASAQLKEQLLEKAFDEIRTTIPSNVPSAETLEELVDSEILAFSLSHSIGEEVQEFSATMKLRVFGALVSKENIISLASAMLESRLPKGKKLIEVNLGKLQYRLESFDSISKIARLRVLLDGDSSLQVSDDLLNKYRLVGMTKREVVEYYSQFENIKKLEVEFFPFYVRRVPQQIDHLEIIIESDTVGVR